VTPRDFIGHARALDLTGGKIGTLIFLYLLATAFESMAVLLLLPTMQFIERRGDVSGLNDSSTVWRVVDEAASAVGATTSLGLLLCLALGAIFARQAVTCVRAIYLNTVREQLVRDVRDRLFESYLAADTALHDRMPAGDLINALAVETRRAVLAITLPIDLVAHLAILAVYVGVLLFISGPLTLVVVAVLVLCMLLLRPLMRRTVEIGRHISDSGSDMLSFLAQRIHSPRLVRLSGTEAAETAMVRRLNRIQFRSLIRAGYVTAQSDVVVEPLIVTIGFSFIYIAYTELGMDLSTISVFLFILLRLMPIAKALIASRQGTLAALGGLEVVRDRLQSLAAAREEDNGQLSFKGVKTEIRLDRVNYRYPGRDGAALNSITVSIPAGRMTAFVGPSGAGKSTLIDLLPRLREPIDGSVTVDGVPLHDFTRFSLRAGIAYVPQVPQLFDVTAAEHIRYGRADASDEDIQRAAHLAGAAEFIAALPNGYDTVLGEAGGRLSGGQRQRLDLARAFVREAPIVILDEPTSQLDVDAERAFREALRRLRTAQDATIIVVAHRLSTIMDADQIVVLRDGRVEASGRHDELLEASPWYRGAWSGQAIDGTRTAAVA
jgi:ABC-type multidrug transport system fused ATPase/permease subunit